VLMVMLYWGEQYFEGVFTGYLGVNFTSGLITECQIAIIKENISHYCDATIEHPQLSHQEKEEQKRQMKQSLEVYIQGVKDEMREETEKTSCSAGYTATCQWTNTLRAATCRMRFG